MGYQPTATVLSVPVTHTSLKNGDIDVFLGNWMPTKKTDIKPDREDGSLETIAKNLTGTRYTLAANRAAADGGIMGFGDIVAARNQFDGKIYGIEPGNDGNRLIQSMIDGNAFGPSGFEVVESSEQGMLAQVARAEHRQEWVVFPGWGPHPMNADFDLVDLSGGDDRFGPDFGEIEGDTNVRKGYTPECPNAGRFLKNVVFTLAMENEIMGAFLVDGEASGEAAAAWLKQHPDVLDGGLDRVRTVSDGDTLVMVKARHGL